jgi:hypothetical protein
LGHWGEISGMSETHDTIHCEDCGGRWDRPGLYHCKKQRHVQPTLSQRIVADIEAEINDRRGIKWGSIDEETLVGLRDKLARIVDRHMADMIT